MAVSFAGSCEAAAVSRLPLAGVLRSLHRATAALRLLLMLERLSGRRGGGPWLWACPPTELGAESCCGVRATSRVGYGGRHTDWGVLWAVRPVWVGICLEEASLKSEPSSFGDAVRL